MDYIQNKMIELVSDVTFLFGVDIRSRINCVTINIINRLIKAGSHPKTPTFGGMLNVTH